MCFPVSQIQKGFNFDWFVECFYNRVVYTSLRILNEKVIWEMGFMNVAEMNNWGISEDPLGKHTGWLLLFFLEIRIK